MQQVVTLNFTDYDSNDGCIIIRAEHAWVAVAFSLKEDGDVELVLRTDECKQFLVHLQRALQIAEAPKTQ